MKETYCTFMSALVGLLAAVVGRRKRTNSKSALLVYTMKQ